MTRRLGISIALAVPLLALMVSDLLPSMPLEHLLTAHGLGLNSRLPHPSACQTGRKSPSIRSHIATAWNTRRFAMVTCCESASYALPPCTRRGHTPEHLSTQRIVIAFLSPLRVKLGPSRIRCHRSPESNHESSLQMDRRVIRVASGEAGAGTRISLNRDQACIDRRQRR